MKRIFVSLALFIITVCLSLALSSCGKGTDGLEFIDIGNKECGVKIGEAVNESVIVIPKKHDGKKVTAILDSGFYKCEGLTEITLPKTIKRIEQKAFYGCESLARVSFNGTVDEWCSIDFAQNYSNPIYYAKKLSINDEEITALNISEATEIKSYAFINLESLTSVTMGESVITMGESSFAGCANLKTVSLSSNLREINKFAFIGCNLLESITVPASVNYVNCFAFYNCKIKSISFENLEGWFITKDENAKSGTKKVVDDSQANAKELCHEDNRYHFKSWAVKYEEN